mgnify:CR=1 FL=1
MYDKSQLMRGTLEGCILKILSKIHLMVMKLLQLFWVMDLKI